MKLSDVKNHLGAMDNLTFVLENGEQVPAHFHITEVGLITKRFIDCGNTVRNETVVSMQLWDANDYDHRLAPEKLLKIIATSEKVLGIEDHEVEIEYQGGTIGKYGLNFNGNQFVLTNKQTACLADDQCGVPVVKKKIALSELQCCQPGGGCC